MRSRRSSVGIKNDSRAKALVLLNALDTYYKNPPMGYVAQDFLSNGDAYMIGVLVTNRGKTLASKSGVACSRGFEFTVRQLGYVLAESTVENLRRFTKGFDPKAHPTKHKHYGTCALPKVVSASTGYGGYPVGVTEMYFSPEEAQKSVSAVGEGGETQNFYHGSVVPSCDTCRTFSPQQMLGLQNRKYRSGGEATRRKFPSKIKKGGQKHRHHERSALAEEGRDLAASWPHLADEFYDDDDDYDDDDPYDDYDVPDRY